MKKALTILTATVFIVATLAPVAAAGGRGHGHRHHVHYRHYHGGHGNFWLGLGLGVLTGAIVSSFHYSPPPPRQRVYYERAPVVVSRPPVVVRTSPRETAPKSYGRAPSAAFGMVTVTASELNMRSGPGLNRDVVGLARKGDVLAVIDSIPNWFYVRKANGRYGWVMDRYTRPSGPVG